MLCDHRAYMSWVGLLASADISGRACPSCHEVVRYGPWAMMFANGCLALAGFMALGWAGTLRSYWPFVLVPATYAGSRLVLVTLARPRLHQPTRHSLLWFAVLLVVLMVMTWAWKALV